MPLVSTVLSTLAPDQGLGSRCGGHRAAARAPLYLETAVLCKPYAFVCPSESKWLNQLWYIHPRSYYS